MQETSVFFAPEPASDLVKAAVYGIGSSGKTALGSCAPEEWGVGIYIAADITSGSLKSVYPAIRDRLIVITPTGYVERLRDKPGYHLKPGEDPDQITMSHFKEEAYDLAGRNWPLWLTEKAKAALTGEALERALDKISRIGWGFWDSFTQTADEMMRESTKKHWFHDKKPTSGPRTPEVEYGRKWAQPDKGDYNMVQGGINEIIERWNRQPFHTIASFQEAMQREDAAKARHLLFGPCTVGQVGPRQVPNRFDFNFWLSRDIDPKENPRGFIRVQLQRAEDHVAGAKATNVQEAIKDVYKIIEPGLENGQKFWQWVSALNQGR